jgi:hypothetical protein
MKKYQKKAFNALNELKSMKNIMLNIDERSFSFIIEEMMSILETSDTRKEFNIMDRPDLFAYVILLLPLKGNEMVRLFFDILKVNLKILYADDNVVIVSSKVYEKIHQKQITVQEIAQVMKTKDQKGIQNLTEKIGPDLLQTLFEMNEHLMILKEVAQVLKDNYYDVNGFINQEQYQAIIKSLEKVNISFYFLNLIKKELKKTIGLEAPKKEIVSNSLSLETMDLAMIHKNAKKRILPKKEWKNLMDKSYFYYNLDRNCEIRDLTPLEVVEFLEILKKLNYSEKDINKILKRLKEKFSGSNLSLVSDNSLRLGFEIREIYQKLLYLGLTDYTSYIDELLEEMKKTTTAKERNIWKNELWNTLREAYQQMPHDYEYEKLKLDARLRKKEMC